jgi:FlaA1/EpsC-like NDP-sugar epimerase
MRRAGRLTIDSAVSLVAFLLSMWLRLGDDFDLNSEVIFESVVFAIACMAVFTATGTSFHSWRFFGMRDMFEIARDVTISIGAYTAASFIFSRLDAVPRSVPLICWFILLFSMIATRLLYRAIVDNTFTLTRTRINNHIETRVLVYGANARTEAFLSGLAANQRGTIEVVGIIDDDKINRDRRVERVKVLTNLGGLSSLVADFVDSDPPITQLVVSDPGIGRTKMRAIVDAASAAGLRVVRVPQATELLRAGGNVKFESVEVTDLLGREQVTLNLAEIDLLIRGRCALVTGAGGSIGSELCKQILMRKPRRLLLVEHSEFNLFNINNILIALPDAQGVEIVPCLMSVRDQDRINRLFATERPDLVFHAAAYKHVHLIEQHPVEGAWTNVVGTSNVAHAALANGAQAMIMVSTDKAVNPTSMMGLSKRVAECICMALDQEGEQSEQRTRFVTVRFGNVLGSSGSVVPIFENQIRAGGPITVTDERVTRYFMTIPEAVQLILQGSVYALAHKQSRSAVLVLDMGEPIRILDLAKRMIALSGLVEGRDISIEIIGLRPGEKMHEELFDDQETYGMTSSAGILEARSRFPSAEEMRALVTDIESACRGSDSAMAVSLMSRVIQQDKAAAQ